MSRAKSDSLQGTLDLLVLKILALRGPMHGYGITQNIERISDEVLRVEEGSLYPALHRMEEVGWIHACWVTTENKRRARMYELTAAGRKQLLAEQARWSHLSGAVTKVLRFA
jgi:PadR family transcriptional regulator, regulatory protein PadR